MKLTYTVLLDVDDHAQATEDGKSAQALAEEIRVCLASLVSQRLPVRVNDLRIWTKATPYARKRLTVERIEPTASGQYRVVVTASDNRTAVRTFPSRNAAEAWANKVDPLPLP